MHSSIPGVSRWMPVIKKGLADFPELISGDFTYHYILMTAESMTKIQLIEKNVQENPSGLEVIK